MFATVSLKIYGYSFDMQSSPSRSHRIYARQLSLAQVQQLLIPHTDCDAIMNLKPLMVGSNLVNIIRCCLAVQDGGKSSQDIA